MVKFSVSSDIWSGFRLDSFVRPPLDSFIEILLSAKIDSRELSGLFSQVILQSGSAFSPWATTGEGEPNNKMDQFVETLGCSSNTAFPGQNGDIRGPSNQQDQAILQCMQSKSTDDILKAQMPIGMDVSSDSVLWYSLPKLFWQSFKTRH